MDTAGGISVVAARTRERVRRYRKYNKTKETYEKEVRAMNLKLNLKENNNDVFTAKNSSELVNIHDKIPEFFGLSNIKLQKEQ